LIRCIAYEPQLFERSVSVLSKIAEVEDLKDDSYGAKKALATLFYPVYSGTLSTIDQRLPLLKSLLTSEESAKRRIGIAALDAALEAWQFTPYYSFEFGAHSRSYGYWPTSRGEVERWFGSVLGLVAELACGQYASAPQVRETLAQQLRGLWNKTAMYDELDRVCRIIAQSEFWPDGWQLSARSNASMRVDLSRMLLISSAH
jgi:hypothetical protein